MMQPSMQPARPSSVILHDDFSRDLRRVIGSVVPAHPSFIRRGVDVERVLSIDHRALRIQPLARPGWGRSGIAYGPFKRSPGLALAVLVNNGHNLSQSYELKSWLRQAGRWLKGSGTEPMPTRIVRWLGHRPRMSLARKLHRWYLSREGGPKRPPVKESLAVGFFPEAVPADPLAAGHGIAIHASDDFDNGELWTRVGDGHTSTCTSLQNLPMYYIVVLHDRGATYYASSLAGAHGVGSYPMMRPVAIDPAHDDPELFAAAYQAVLGEIGFTMDTRIHGVKVAELGPQWGGGVQTLEDLPREVPIPPELDMGPPPAPGAPADAAILIRDDFSGPRGDLAGHRTTMGDKVWRKDFGSGAFEITGQSAARVVADIGVPSPGRTIYTVEWDDPAFADIDLEMTPPGTRRGETHRGRGGVVFWQDPRNYILINLWLHDNLPTASISAFFYIKGFDDLYDAVWTCTGPNRTVWGVPFRFRTIFDGNHFLVRINEEPVLERALTDVYPHLSRLTINRIGLIANWEWGTDTGTVFRDFGARGRKRTVKSEQRT